MNTENKTLVVAFGGNALLDDSGNQSFDYQYQIVCQAVKQIADLYLAGWKVLVVHGNGPQVGFELRRSELARHEVSPVPLDYAVAETQGSIGYMFQRALYNELAKRDIAAKVVVLLTQTIVDSQDAAFANPSKPVGSFMDEQTAKQMQQEAGWAVMEDAGRGWRRAVASPKPIRVVETEQIRAMLEQGSIVVAAGGGGMAVSEDRSGCLKGLEAVIDKDLTASLLAVDLQAQYLLIPTGVEKVAIYFGKPEQQWLDTLSPEKAHEFMTQGQFGKGSMQPKIEALLKYIEAYPQGRGIITSPNSIAKALAGETGTHIRLD